MTINEEIERLNKKLDRTENVSEQAELLVELMRKCISVRNIDIQPYLERLKRLAKTIDVLNVLITTSSLASINIRLVTTEGKMIETTNINEVCGAYTYTFDMRNLSAGIIIVLLTMATNHL